MSTATPPTPPVNPGFPSEFGPRYSVAVPYVTTGATQWHPIDPAKAPDMRGSFETTGQARAWAREHIPGCAFEVVRTDAPTSLAPTFPCILVRFTVTDADGWSMSRSTVIPASPDASPAEVAAALAAEGDEVYWPSHESAACAGTDFGAVETVPNIYGDGRTGYALEIRDNRGDGCMRVITIDGCVLCEDSDELDDAQKVAEGERYPQIRELNAHLAWTEHQWARSWEWCDHGVMASDFFQGAGVSFTRWQACYTGCGSSLREAANDALEQAATDGWELPAALEKEAEDQSDECTTGSDGEDGEGDDFDVHHYVTVFVSREEET